MNKLYFLGGLLLLPWLPARAQTSAPLNLRWLPRQDLNVLLPPSVRVYETNATLPDGRRLRAMYTKMALNDRNLRLRAVGEERGSTFRQRTTQEYAEANNAIWAANGGFFSATASASLIVSDGNHLAPNQKAFAQGTTTIYPTRGAFGLINRKPDVAWVYSVGSNTNDADNTVYAYPNPNSGADLTRQPTATFPSGAAIWNASQAMGGTPVLVHEGIIRITGPEENTGGEAFLGPNPRTAVGYLPGDTVVVVAIDGRQQASGGTTIAETAQLMLDLGCIEALNLDGGGSTTMLAAGEVVNNPSDRDGGDRNQQRRNASALVLSEAVPTARRAVTIIDSNSPQYNELGLWSNTNHASYYAPTVSRAATVGSINTKVRYNLGMTAPGRYQLAAWWTLNQNNAEQVPYVLHRGTRTDTVRVNQKDLSTTGRWNVLGSFDLGPGDYVELLAQGRNGTQVIADALRLVELERSPNLPPRGSMRIAVLSDLNGSLGSSTYEWQVDSIMQRIPRIWQPDLVVCGGDMVAGQGVTETVMRTMWQGFDRSVASKFRASNVPFAFTLGNHDGTRSNAAERLATTDYWQNPDVKPKLDFVDDSNYPVYYSFKQGDAFFVSWDASSDVITDENLRWVREQFSSPAARAAKMRFVIGHLPLYSVAQERDSPGNILRNGEQLRKTLEELDVTTYISGHHHAYFPGKRGDLELLNAGAAGSGPRPWLTLEKAPVNTITLMDVYFDQDSVAYTTYDIMERNAADMSVFDPSVLPRIIYSYNGTFIIRRDAQPEASSAALSAVHLETGLPEQATGTAQVTLGGNSVQISGSFANLQSPLLEDRGAVAIYGGPHGEAGRLVSQLTVVSADGRTGTFRGTLSAKSDTILDQLMAGGLFVKLKTTASPEGEIRGQLYAARNQAPARTAVTSTRAGNVYAVRNLEAIFAITWARSPDPDGDPVTYLYQVAADSSFTNVLYQTGTGRISTVRRREDAWYALLGNTPAGTPVTFYQRILSSDGKHVTAGPARVLQLTKSDAPLTDLVEVPAPEYRYDGRVTTITNGYGTTFDGFGQVWYLDFSGRVFVQKLDGSAPAFTSPLLNSALGLSTSNTGISTDQDGHILLCSNSRLVKIDARTGQIVASWTAPPRANGSANTLTQPQADAQGQVYANSLWGDDFTYVLKQNGATYDLVRRLTLPGRVLSRSFAIEPDGLTLYLPDPGTAQIQRFVSADGLTYRLDGTITSLAAGSSGIQVKPGRKLYAAVRASGVVPPSFHFRDEENKRLWTLPLPELPANSEARGLGVSATGDTLIYAAFSGGGIHRYVRVRPGGPAPVVRNIPTYTIESVRTTVAATGVADSVGVYCKLVGVVNSPSFRATGLDFSLVDGTHAINVFRAADNANYPVRMGDQVRVIGRVIQENGLIRFQTDSVRLLAAAQPVVTPAPVAAFTDELESLPVELRQVRLLDPAQWTTGQGFPGFGVDVRDEAGGIFRLYISQQTALYNQPAPQGAFVVRGVVSQFQPEAPYLAGYELWPRFREDLVQSIVTSNQNQQPGSGFQLYPNPTDRVLHVEAGTEKIARVEIVSMQGQVVMREAFRNPRADVKLRVDQLASGVYLLRVTTEKQTVTKRFQKE